MAAANIAQDRICLIAMMMMMMMVSV